MPDQDDTARTQESASQSGTVPTAAEHPVGTTVGAASGVATGAAVGGVVGGPIGAALGAAVGAVAGGFFGKVFAEDLNPVHEEAHWREHYPREPYARPDRTFDDYAAAYRVGYLGRTRHQAGTKFEEAEPHLRAAYEYELTQSGTARLDWEEARNATLAAWNRVDRVHGSGSGMGAGPTAG